MLNGSVSKSGAVRRFFQIEPQEVSQRGIPESQVEAVDVGVQHKGVRPVPDEASNLRVKFFDRYRVHTYPQNVYPLAPHTTCHNVSFSNEIKASFHKFSARGSIWSALP